MAQLAMMPKLMPRMTTTTMMTMMPTLISSPCRPTPLRMYGLPVIEDELFEEQEAFNSSSEPSFTDFFETSTDSEAGAPDTLNENGDDDDEFTTDSDEDHDISDLEGGLLDAPLIAHIGTDPNGAPVEGAEDGTVQPEMPLLVIEDLDGRLIYAKQGW